MKRKKLHLTKMIVILIDCSAYSLTEKPFKELQKVRESRKYKDGEREFMMREFLDAHQNSYKYLGEIYFDIKH